MSLWISENEGSKFWLSVLTDLQTRGLKDVFIFCADGLTAFLTGSDLLFYIDFWS